MEETVNRRLVAPPASRVRLTLPHPPPYPLPVDTVFPTTLDGLRRRSICCHAAVEHPFPETVRTYRRFNALRCTLCGRLVDDFEVVNARNERIWPVPSSFDPPADVKLTLLNADMPLTYKIHAQGKHAKLILRLLR